MGGVWGEAGSQNTNRKPKRNGGSGGGEKRGVATFKRAPGKEPGGGEFSSFSPMMPPGKRGKENHEPGEGGGEKTGGEFRGKCFPLF